MHMSVLKKLNDDPRNDVLNKKYSSNQLEVKNIIETWVA